MRFLPVSATAAERQLLSADDDVIIEMFRTTRTHVVRELMFSESMVVIARNGGLVRFILTLPVNLQAAAHQHGAFDNERGA